MMLSVIPVLALVLLAAGTFAAGVQADQGHHHGPQPVASPAPAAPPSMHQHAPDEPAHTHGTAATPEQQAAAARLLAEIRSAAVKFTDFRTAEALGYRQSTPFRFGSWGPAHFGNRAYKRDGRLLDPAHPESLMFLRLPNGEMTLLGVMFLAPRGEGPRPGGPITEWHVHENLCVNDSGKAGLARRGQCPTGFSLMGARAEMMHVWLFDHPKGPFGHMLDAEAIRVAVKYATGGK